MGSCSRSVQVLQERMHQSTDSNIPQAVAMANRSEVFRSLTPDLVSEICQVPHTSFRRNSQH